MRKIFLITFAVLVSGALTSVQAQNNHHFDRQAFFEKRKAFIIKELGLTPKEQAEFIPLMEEYQQKKFECGQRCRRLSRALNRKRDTPPSDAEYLEAADECVAADVKGAELEKEYFEKFKKVLAPEKLYNYKGVEFRFARDFIRNAGQTGKPR